MASRAATASLTSSAQAGVGARLASIDALRGIVMALMLIDHMRETIYLHMQIGDPVDVDAVQPALFFTRLTATICAPVFIALTGLSAWLYGQSHSPKNTSIFLLKRGFFLVILEIMVINFAWTGQWPPDRLYLQVIWCIGLCMIALAGLLHLPRPLQIVFAMALIAGHNLLDPITFAPSDALYVPWSILHDRGWIGLTDQIQARTSYPILPWVGVILVGYLAGPLFDHSTAPDQRLKVFVAVGLALLCAFILFRLIDVYGDIPWSARNSALKTSMAFLSLTKYPPSLLFSMFTLGLGALLFAWLMNHRDGLVARVFAPFGAAPMFFYILHLYVLKIINVALVSAYGTNKGDYFGVDHVWMIWAASGALLLSVYLPTVWFAQFKQRRRDLRWLRYL